MEIIKAAMRYTNQKIVLMLLLICMSILGSSNVNAKTSIYSLSPKKVVDYAKSAPGKKVIFFYASWCGYCRKSMPSIINIERTRPNSIIAVSVDKKSSSLLNYIGNIKNVPFNIIQLKGNDTSGIERMLRVPARRGIPFMIFLDENDNVVFSGNTSPAKAAEFVLR